VIGVTALFRFERTLKRDPAIEGWLREHDDELGALAHHCFALMRSCGDDVCETLHDGQPTACVGDAAFAYVDAFRVHVNVGFFHGAELPDPEGLLEGTGKRMRHVKLRSPGGVNDASLEQLIRAAYADIRRRLKSSPRA